MNNHVFRKVSLDRLSSPEQLDTLMKVTSPRGWLALAALGLLLAAAIVWGFLGTVSTKVATEGVLIQPGGLQTVYASSSGLLTDIRVVENDYVQKGNVIARMEQPQLLQQLERLTNEWKALEAAYANKPSEELEEQIASYRQTIADAKEDYLYQTSIVSAYTGRVLAVNVKKGSSIEAGTSVISLESGETGANNLKTVLYVPVQTGKKIIPGMTVDVTPSSVNKEEYGFMIGRVASVSEFPLTTQSMFLTLGNEALVRELAGEGEAMLEVSVELIPDSSTVSGYKWSTSDGPPQQMDSGTLVSASITVKRQKPIASIIPQLK
ncbi:NHLP bacteriocin system secretion protein [Cohnella fermenti]|uniref:NHLP bacteriocin system secretion protein n=1 Tax=Cohnella fermenti TaxID=2565925 RepID=A0A4V6RXI7_9BACL|nr:NHLP bacteriocin system secretion protein [Cohnella fermenti]THF77144.1 NHLP bacteriocin system secretion protein [Cohnella fermenti]